jgi:hypothetical protein
LGNKENPKMIDTLKKIIDKYYNLGIVKAGELLLSPVDAIRLADELEQRGILILGVDLWYYIGNKIAEDPGSLDLSEITNVKDSAKLAIEFIQKHLPEKTEFVSFVLEEDRIFESEELSSGRRLQR